MKTITKLLMLVAIMLSMTINAQNETDIGNLLRTLSDNPISSGFTAGCCIGDPDNHVDTDESLCVPQIYIINTSASAGGDLFFTGDVLFRNCEVRIVGGGNFIVDNGDFIIGTDFCPADLVIEETSNFYESMAEYDAAQETLGVKDYEYAKTIEIDYVVNIIGQKFKLKNAPNGFLIVVPVMYLNETPFKIIKR